MKRSKSRRNRHTGKINAAKARILAFGTQFETSDGTRYRREMSPRTMEVMSDYWVNVGYTAVRVPNP